MADSEKPFACSSPGCNMSFTNEDHLVVHKKKHDMVLNLGAGGKNGVFVADQTPTPTRFIRNCEEVGLFQDLQNVNPFEETFRRAVESGKIGALADSELDTNDDTLHTPHVFPHIKDDPSPYNRVVSEVEVASDLSKNENTKNTADEKMVENVTLTKSIKKTTETIVIQEADTSIIPPVLTTAPSLSINGEEVQLLLKTQDGSLVQLSAIPVCNFPNNTSSNNSNNTETPQSKAQTIVLKTALTLKNSETIQTKNATSSRLTLAKMRLRQALTKNSTRGKIDRVSQHPRNINEKLRESLVNKNEACANVTKKQEILERNRASSMRSRAKRKEWIQQLEKNVKNVNAINTTLQLEIKSLQAEVTKLKTILLAHNNCSVTTAMKKGNGIIVKSEIIPIPTSQFIQSTSIPSSDSTSIHGIKRNLIVNNIPIVPKKQSLIFPTTTTTTTTTTKQSILLPKTEDNPLSIITKIYHKNASATTM